jgi:hypothetical protein
MLWGCVICVTTGLAKETGMRMTNVTLYNVRGDNKAAKDGKGIYLQLI